MSGVLVVRYLLANNAAVLAVVPATRIYSGTVPQGEVLPAIGVGSVSGVPRNTVSMAEAKRLITERVQVTVHVAAGGYADQADLIELVRKACPTQRGTVNGVTVDSILPDTIGPDLDDPETRILEKSRDFIVKWFTA